MSQVKFVAVGAILQQVFSFFILVFLTRSLGAEGYGKIVTFLAIMNTIASFSFQWATPFVVRTESIYYLETKKIGLSYFIPLSISFVLLLIIWLNIVYDPLNQFESLKNYPLPTLFAYSIGFFIYQIAKISYQIQKKFIFYGLIMPVDKVILFLSIVVLFFLKQLSVSTAIIAYAISILITGLSCLFHSLFKKINLKNQVFHYRDYFKSSSSIAASVIIHYFSSQPFVILISQELGSAHLAGWLGIGYTMIGVLLQPFMWLSPTLLPKFSVEMNTEDADLLVSDYIKRTVLTSTILLLWGVLGIISVMMFIPHLLSFLGKGFQGGEIIISLLILLAIPEALNVLLVSILYAKKLEKIMILIVAFKITPFIIGYFLKQPIEIELILLNLGSWIGIALNLFFIKNHILKINYLAKLMALCILLLFIAGLLFLNKSIFLLLVTIGMSCYFIFHIKNTINHLKLCFR